MHISIEEMKKLARDRDGKCLSKEYINSYSPLRWQCKKGHQWDAVPNSIKRGTWCPACAGKKKGTIEEMKDLARNRCGECISITYINSQSKLIWRCAKGHQWEANPNDIKKGKWCPVCCKITIEEMREIARNHGGECSSIEYMGAHTKLTWECKKGHQWEAIPGSIKSGSWCPACAGKKKGTIEEMREIAKNRGGECLSVEYINGTTKLEWRCR